MNIRFSSYLRLINIALLIGASFGLGKAQGADCNPASFDLAPSYQIGANANAYVEADFNTDGKIDIAAINREVRTVSVIVGDGVGGFGPPQIFPTTINPWTMTVADLNNDGKPDLVAASFNENKFAILINDGSGGFPTATVYIPPSQFPNQGEFHDLKSGDFNGDGNLDIVAVQYQSGKQLKIFLGNGQGGLTLASTLNITGNEAKIAVGNINSDNLSDIVVSRQEFSSRAVLFVAGNANGNFTLTPSFTMIDSPADIDIQDINGDSKNDLVIANYDTSTPTTHYIQPWIGHGNGTFTAGAQIDLTYQFPPSEVTTADYNNDGKIDIAATLGSNVNSGIFVMVIYGVGDGTFVNRDHWNVPEGTNMIATADVNSDGRPDILAGQTRSSSLNSVSVLLNENFDGFDAPKSLLWGGDILDAGDFNGDGFKDMVSGYSTLQAQSAEIAIAINDPINGLQPDHVFPTASGMRSFRTGDFNGDGKTDIVSIHDTNSGQIEVLLGNGTGTVGNPIPTSIMTGFFPRPLSITVGNFNDDGKDDIFVITEGNKGYSYLSNGDGTFILAPNSPVTIQLTEAPKPVKGDFNLDSKLDLVISRDLWLGDGTGQFHLAPVSIPSLGNLAAGDFNGDGKLDLAGFADSSLKAIPGDGLGGFGGPVIFMPSVSGNQLVAGDFNNDSFADLAFISTDARGNLVIVPSAGSGLAGGPPVFNSVGAAGLMVATDFNADGKVDLGLDAYANRSIVHNTSGLTPCISIGDASIVEPDSGDTNVAFPISLSSIASETVRVNYAVRAGSAGIGTDVRSISGRLEIPAGQTSATILVPVVGDLLDEFDEDFTVNLASPSNASLTKSVALGTVVDNDAEPTLTITDVSVNEGSFSTQFVFNATLSAPSGKLIGFRFTAADGTALANTDYLPVSSLWNITAGNTSTAFNVTVLGDSTYEANEEFFVNITEPSNVTIADGQGKGTIVNDDPIPTLNIFGTSVTEGNSGTTSRPITLQLSNPTYLPVTVNVLTSDGTAIGGQDFVASDSPVTIPAGQQSFTSNIQVIGDTLDESNETFFVNAYNVANATLGTPQSSVVIVDDDPLPALSIANTTIAEGSGGPSIANIAVSLLAASGREVRVNYSTVNGTATSPLDYTQVSGTLVFAAGEVSKTISVPIVSDGIVEPNETFQISLSGPVNASLAINTATVTILNDDHAGNRADFDGDGKTDISVFRPGDTNWYIYGSTAGVRITNFGSATDALVPGDYDGDGKTDIAVFRDSTGEWQILRSSDSTVSTQLFGMAGDKPVAGDYDGDGKTDQAVYRPSQGLWAIFRSSDAAVQLAQWGNATDRPVPGDYDGDGKTDIGVYRDGDWYVFQSTAGPLIANWGVATDKPVPADYDGDGKDDIAAFRPSGGLWAVYKSSDNTVMLAQWGNETDIPVPGDYDGDGSDDFAVYRNGDWYVYQSTAGPLIASWGNATDTPIPAKYIP